MQKNNKTKNEYQKNYDIFIDNFAYDRYFKEKYYAEEFLEDFFINSPKYEDIYEI